MSARTLLAAIFASVLLWDGVAGAQVLKAAIHTTGISCGVCAAISEAQFRRLPGVETVAISLSTETITLYYKYDSSFDPRQIRRVLQPLGVGVLDLQVSARGKVHDEGTTSVFLAGKDRFSLAVAGGTADLPRNTAVLVEAILDDGPTPSQLKISKFTPLK